MASFILPTSPPISSPPLFFRRQGVFLKRSAARCSGSSTALPELRICRQCKNQYDPSLNHAAACRFHTAHFGGPFKLYSPGFIHYPNFCMIFSGVVDCILNREIRPSGSYFPIFLLISTEKKTGETKRKFESVHTGGTMSTPESGKILLYWHCCGAENPSDQGCTLGPHSSYDDE